MQDHHINTEEFSRLHKTKTYLFIQSPQRSFNPRYQASHDKLMHKYTQSVVVTQRQTATMNLACCLCFRDHGISKRVVLCIRQYHAVSNIHSMASMVANVWSQWMIYDHASLSWCRLPSTWIWLETRNHYILKTKYPKQTQLTVFQVIPHGGLKPWY